MIKSAFVKTLTTFSLFALVIASCSKKLDNVQGLLMVVNASPGFGPIDVFLDDTKLNSAPLGYAGTTAYTSTVLGNHKLKTTTAGSSAVLTDGNLNVIGNIHQSLFFYGPSTALQGALVDDPAREPDAGKAHVRFFNLSSGSGTVDFFGDDGIVPVELYSDRGFEAVDSIVAHAGFKTITPGTYDFVVKSGTSPAVLTTLPNIQILEKKSYTIYFGGIAGGSVPPGLQVITHEFIR
ncbi:MAG: DUF4397 domain-containing protein [Chitinophagaceae bacterium]|nr:DUF4397 domain-containing protein [Chitinophagaceae bacterium]